VNFLLEPSIWLLVLIVSALGTCVTLAYYYLGKQGADAVLDRFPKLKQEQWDRVQRLYEEHGSGLLFLVSLPWIGILFAAVAGAVGIRLVTYCIWVLLGRIVRNWIIVLVATGTLSFLIGD
jgi:membrane protein YqaA with SNARE-associated domain